MSGPNQNLKSYIQELVKEIEEEIDESTATGNVAGYQTPNAFGNDSQKSKKKTKDVATQAGYTVVNDDIRNINEGIDSIKDIKKKLLSKSGLKFNDMRGNPIIAKFATGKYGVSKGLEMFNTKGKKIKSVVMQKHEIDNWIDAIRNFIIESTNKDEIPGGLSDNKTLKDIANKHKVDIDDLMGEYRKGIKAEMEHTSDPKIAAEITRDHLYEDSKYYTKLATIENESVNESISKSYVYKIYDTLSKGDEINIKYSSSIRKDHNNTFVVSKGKTVVGKRKVERITLKLKDKPKATKFYLYNDNKNIGMAIGDLAATITDIKIIKNKHIRAVSESVNEGREIGDVLQHKHNTDISIELVATTKRGWKVKETTKKGKRSKTRIQYYDDQDISGDKSLYEDCKKPKRKNRWLELKNDKTNHPNKKLALGLKELKYKLQEVESFIRWYNKISKMNELSSDTYWKRTHTNIYKIKERLINIAKTIQELEK